MDRLPVTLHVEPELRGLHYFAAEARSITTCVMVISAVVASLHAALHKQTGSQGV